MFTTRPRAGKCQEEHDEDGGDAADVVAARQDAPVVPFRRGGVAYQDDSGEVRPRPVGRVAVTHW